MKILVILGVFAVLGLLRLVRVKMLTWVAAWWIAAYVIVVHSFDVSVPWSVVQLFMAIVSGALVAYVTSDAERWRQVRDPLVAFMTEPRYRVPVAAVVVLAPILLGWAAYRGATKPPIPPGFGRTVHPAPPASITVHEEEFDLARLDNPLAELEGSDREAFERHLENGREIYYQNCFYCHGDAMRGEGMFAHGLNPIPTNFRDPGTIAMLQSSYLFWRVSKGAPGLPAEGGPWESAMPAWEQFLSEEEIWEVILYLYEFTGHEPRAQEAVH